MANHLSRLELQDNEASQVHINDSLQDEQLLALSHADFNPWFLDFVNYLSTRVVPSEQTNRFFAELRH